MGEEIVALAIDNLSYVWENKTIINQLNLRVNQGEKVGVIGANGAGKTTLFLLICGVLTPSEGRIYLFEQQVKPGKFYPDIGLVFQNPDDQLFCSTVREDIAFGPENMGLSNTEISQRVAEALLLTGTTSLADRVPYELSGGEKCMVAIATVLAMQPRLILYDEPSANLDLRARRRLIKFLQSATHSYLIASHDLELIQQTCDRLILLSEGRIVADGIPREIMSDRLLMETHGLEVPGFL